MLPNRSISTGVGMPDRHVALLRGINVGKAKRIAMADLRDAVGSLGHTEVKTLLNSGNVVFTAADKPTEKALYDAIKNATGVSSDVILVTGKQLDQIVDQNPLTDVMTDPSRLMVMFFTDADDRAADCASSSTTPGRRSSSRLAGRPRTSVSRRHRCESANGGRRRAELRRHGHNPQLANGDEA